MAQRKTKTISIPPDLDKRLDKFPEENWSAVACQAFDVRLTQLESMNATSNDLNATIARLRASKKGARNDLYQRGEAEGVEYVMKVADWLDLERLEKQVEQDEDWAGNASFLEVLRVTEDLADDPSTLNERLSDYRDSNGDDPNHQSWVEGFVRGALKRYNDIKRKL